MCVFRVPTSDLTTGRLYLSMPITGYELYSNEI